MKVKIRLIEQFFHADSDWKLSDRNGAPKPSKLYVEIKMDNIPLLAVSLSLMKTLNFNKSSSVFQSTPNVCSSGRLWSKSSFFIPAFLCSSGIYNKTLLLFLQNFVKLNPPSKHIDLTFFIKWIGCLHLLQNSINRPHKSCFWEFLQLPCRKCTSFL